MRSARIIVSFIKVKPFVSLITVLNTTNDIPTLIFKFASLLIRIDTK